ncbi:hypothetical protein DPMN_124614 [Dreissena polymorpha]|uniref:Uncharacterized protein n=1 Tax=Dreissena polymorpha TaxID=45954 RepID=A0A9D4GVX9_DREPO|nr:hypothetical protein DPMN_124614 [Dreissena polymorpha]
MKSTKELPRSMCGNKNCHMTTNANDHGYFSDKTSIEDGSLRPTYMPLLWQRTLKQVVSAPA